MPFDNDLWHNYIIYHPYGTIDAIGADNNIFREMTTNK